MKTVVLSDRCAALIQGAGAVSYMAARLAELNATMMTLRAPSPSAYQEADKAASDALAALNRCMNVLGDYLSNCDAVEDCDEAATDAAFARMRDVLTGA